MELQEKFERLRSSLWRDGPSSSEPPISQLKHLLDGLQKEEEKLIQRITKRLSKGKDVTKKLKRERNLVQLQLSQVFLISGQEERAFETLTDEHEDLKLKSYKRALAVATGAVENAQGNVEEAIANFLDALNFPKGKSGYGNADIMLLCCLALETERRLFKKKMGKWRSPFKGFLDEAYMDAFLQRPLRYQNRTFMEWKRAAETWMDLAETCFQAGDVRLALCALLHAKLVSVDRVPSISLWNKLCIVFWLIGEKSRALEICEAGFSKAPFQQRSRLFLTIIEPKKWSEYFRKEHSRILSVQRQARCFVARAKLNRRRYKRRAIVLASEAYIDSLTHFAIEGRVLQVRCIVQLQCWCRSQQAKRFLLHLRSAARIQRCFRCSRDRQSLKIKRKAVLRIQSNFRGFVRRRVFSQAIARHRAATRIQCCFKCSQARQKIYQIKREHFEQFVVNPIITFQAIIRRILVFRGLSNDGKKCYHEFEWTSVSWRLSSWAHDGPEISSDDIKRQRTSMGVQIGNSSFFNDNAIKMIQAKPQDVVKLLLTTRSQNEIFPLPIKSFHSLREIGFEKSAATENILQELWSVLEHSGLQKLRRISFHDTAEEIGDLKFAASLNLRMLSFSCVTSLDLTAVGIADDSCRALVNAFRGSQSLKILSLLRNKIRDRGALWLSILAPNLHELDLSDNRISDSGASALTAVAQRPESQLKKLYLARNSLTELGGLAIKSGIAKRSLLVLDLKFNNISPLICSQIQN